MSVRLPYATQYYISLSKESAIWNGTLSRTREPTEHDWKEKINKE